MDKVMKRLCVMVIALLCLSCGKTDSSYIPNVSVNFSTSLTDPRLSKLTAFGGAVVISGYGVSGIIIYRNATSYVAYDRCSSYEPEKKCAVTLDDPTLTVTDPCSGSKFSLADGSPVKAPATRSLKQYSATVQDNQLYITN
jgi:nitrite reductase/ring-hydroxylating ferredoxin subunit